MSYIANLIASVGIFAILTMALDLLIGYAGLLSFGHAAFFGIGAYTAALLAGVGVNPWIAVAAGGLLGALLSIAVAVPALRLRGDYFVLATFGVSMMVSSVFENWVDVTNGPYGIYGIRGKFWGDLPPGFDLPIFALTVVGFVAALAFVKYRLVGRGFGNSLRAIRGDEVVSESLGKDISRFQVFVFAIAGAMAGIAGALLAYQLRFIEPSQFTFHLTIFVWATLFVGGCGTILGNILGPAILVLVPELLRFAGLSGGHGPHVQQALYGVLLVCIAMFRPQGLVGVFRLR
jgi:branched-chain amino acid transport system permease protein